VVAVGSLDASADVGNPSQSDHADPHEHSRSGASRPNSTSWRRAVPTEASCRKSSASRRNAEHADRGTGDVARRWCLQGSRNDGPRPLTAPANPGGSPHTLASGAGSVAPDPRRRDDRMRRPGDGNPLIAGAVRPPFAPVLIR
jgi:hypothetical protein